MKSLYSWLVVLLIFGFVTGNAQTTVLPFGSSWKYIDNGTDLGTTWTSPVYYDRNWKVGRAQLGYGDGDEATVVSYGTDPNKKYLTTYFRKTFRISNPTLFAKFILQVKRDDGVAVYINGIKRYTSNLTLKPLYNSVANTVCADDGNTIQHINLPISDLVAGNNTIAVEIHQASITDPDLSFDLQLIGNKAPVVNAGLDVSMTLPANVISLNGSLTKDPDGTITKYTWAKVSGPSGDVIATPTKVSTQITNLAVGVYTYRLSATDNSGSTSSDDVVITVSSLNTTTQPTLLVDWSTITLPASGLPDGTRFANNKHRSNVAYNYPTHKK